MVDLFLQAANLRRPPARHPAPPGLHPAPPRSARALCGYCCCCRLLKFGTVTLGEHYKRIAVEGNDYDPYTTLFAGKKKPTNMVASLFATQEVPAE